MYTYDEPYFLVGKKIEIKVRETSNQEINK